MEAGPTQRLRYIAIGGACVAVVATVAILRRRARSTKELAGDERQSSRSAQLPASTAYAVSSTTPAKAVAVARKAPASVSWETLASWANGLKKRDSDDLPTLLEWTERLLKEQPTHDEALPSCLKALANLVGGHLEADRVSAIAVQAGVREPELALEVLNVLFKVSKDRKFKGGFLADVGVVDLALGVLQNSTRGSGERGVYQRACRLLDFIVLDPQNRAVVSSRNGLEILLQVMEKFENDVGVLLEGCSCLRSVAAERGLDVKRAARIIMSCLRKFVENGQLQWRALAALHALPSIPNDLAIPVAELACKAESQHPRFDSVVEWTAKVLHRLATDRSTGVKDWVSSADRRAWLEALKEAPYNLRQPNNGQADIWVSKLCSLCGVR